jgi:hypothetical protein
VAHGARVAWRNPLVLDGEHRAHVPDAVIEDLRKREVDG